MPVVLRILRNFLAANLLFFLPLVWIVSWHVPERLEINVLAPEGLTVKVGFCADATASVEFVRLVSCAGVNGVQTIKSYFADPIDKSNLALSFMGDGRSFELVSISILKHCFVRETLSAADFKNRFELKGETYVPKKGVKETRWKMTVGSDWRLVAVVAFAEVFIFLVCCLLLQVKTRCPRRKNLMDSFSVAFLAAFFFCVAVPLQSYLVNRSIFDFTMSAFMGESVCLLAAVFVFLFGALYYSERSFGRIIHLFVLCLVLYEYLETGVLAIGMPQLNGETWFFANKARQLADTFILVGIIGIPILFYYWIKDVLHWVALGLLILCIASLFDIRSEKQADKRGGFHDYFLSQMDIAKSAVYSLDRNVFVFILDSVTIDAASDAMKADEGLRDKFTGVTAFCNNIGMGPYTSSGLPGIMTGKYQGDELAASDYAYSIFTDKSFIAPYLKSNAYVGFINGLYDYGICSHAKVSEGKGKPEKARAMTPFSRRTSDLLGMNLYEIVRFRLTPFGLKSWYLAMVFMGMDSHAKIESESTLYPILQGAPIDAARHLTLHVYHTHGSHPPIGFDEHGNRVRLGSRDNYEGFLGQTCYVLRQLARLFDNYRARGVYDNSLIVICADHGSVFSKNGKAANLTPRAFPMLWVKPEKAHGSYKESDVTTSHANIAALLRLAVSKTLTRAEIETTLHADKRLYCEGESKWIVDVNGNIQ